MLSLFLSISGNITHSILSTLSIIYKKNDIGYNKKKDRRVGHLNSLRVRVEYV